MKVYLQWLLAIISLTLFIVGALAALFVAVLPILLAKFFGWLVLRLDEPFNIKQ